MAHKVSCSDIPSKWLLCHCLWELLAFMNAMWESNGCHLASLLKIQVTLPSCAFFKAMDVFFTWLCTLCRLGVSSFPALSCSRQRLSALVHFCCSMFPAWAVLLVCWLVCLQRCFPAFTNTLHGEAFASIIVRSHKKLYVNSLIFNH